MATSNLTQRPQETGTPEAEEVRKISGFADLLLNPHDYPDRDRANRAATNILYPVNNGIRAIGELLWRAGLHDGGSLDTEILNGIGGLLIHLSEVQEAFAWIESNTRTPA